MMRMVKRSRSPTKHTSIHHRIKNKLRPKKYLLERKLLMKSRQLLIQKSSKRSTNI